MTEFEETAVVDMVNFQVLILGSRFCYVRLEDTAFESLLSIQAVTLILAYNVEDDHSDLSVYTDMRHLLASGLCMGFELDIPAHGGRIVSSAEDGFRLSVTVGVLAASETLPR